jgi:hypothetical protein
MNETLQAEDNVWYRQFYVWLIIFLPACAVAASFATLYIAVQNRPEMVVADYGNIEAISTEFADRNRRALELGLIANVTFTEVADRTAVAVNLRSSDAGALPSVLQMRVTHSTVANLDDIGQLAGGEGYYTGTINLPGGAYDFHIEDEQKSWRLSTRVTGSAAALELAPYQPSQQNSASP